MTRNELRDVAMKLVDALQALTLEAEQVAGVAQQFAQAIDAGTPVDSIGIPTAYSFAERAINVIRASAKLDAFAMMLADEGK